MKGVVADSQVLSDGHTEQVESRRWVDVRLDRERAVIFMQRTTRRLLLWSSERQ